MPGARRKKGTGKWALKAVEAVLPELKFTFSSACEQNLHAIQALKLMPWGHTNLVKDIMSLPQFAYIR